MLRIIVISLVVANLLLLAFQSSKPAAPTETRPAAPAEPAARDSGVPTIHLFSEMMQDQGLLAGNRRCFTLGPFHAPGDRDETRLRLQDVSTRIGERQTEALVEKGYWVYMPPYASLLEANEALFKLQALGLQDVAIIYDGEWKNSISLGYFMRQENAQRRKKALEDRGYGPKMRIQRQAEPRYWLDYEQQPGAGLVALDMRDRPNDFMQRPVPCPETDSPEAELPAPEVVAAQATDGNPDMPQAPDGAADAVSEDGTPDVSAGAGQSGQQTAPEPEVAGEGGEETAAGADAATGTDDAAGPGAAEITRPKQAVGTGPADTVAAGPASEPDAGADKPLDDGGTEASGAPAGDATEQPGPAGKKEDGGNGTGQRR